MDQHQQKIELMRKYADKIGTGFSFHIKGDIPSKKIDNAIKKHANGLDRDTIIGLYDTTITGNGKSGYIFTDTKVYYLQTLEKPKKLWYDDIESVETTTGKKQAHSLQTARKEAVPDPYRSLFRCGTAHILRAHGISIPYML